VDLLMLELNKRLAMKELKVKLTENAKSFIIDNGYDPVYGARPLKRFLQKHVETLAATEILKGDIKAGQTLTIDFDSTLDKLVANAE